MVRELADAQNDSYYEFDRCKFGATLGYTFTGQPQPKTTRQRFNAMFKEELLRVSL